VRRAGRGSWSVRTGTGHHPPRLRFAGASDRPTEHRGDERNGRPAAAPRGTPLATASSPIASASASTRRRYQGAAGSTAPPSSLLLRCARHMGALPSGPNLQHRSAPPKLYVAMPVGGSGWRSMLLERGATPWDVAQQLGHTDGGQLVMELYRHPSEAGARARLLGPGTLRPGRCRSRERDGRGRPLEARKHRALHVARFCPRHVVQHSGARTARLGAPAAC
jgi:hypothetical protein